MSEETLLRPLAARDIPTLIEIERECLGSAWNVRAYLAELENPAAVYRVAEGDGRMVGFGGLTVILDEAHIASLAVLPAWRGRGLGEALLRALLAGARERGALGATLEVRAGNVAAQRLYAKLGFRCEGVRRAYYPDTGEDAHLLWLRRLTL